MIYSNTVMYQMFNVPEDITDEPDTLWWYLLQH